MSEDWMPCPVFALDSGRNEFKTDVSLLLFPPSPLIPDAFMTRSEKEGGGRKEGGMKMMMMMMMAVVVESESKRKREREKSEILFFAKAG